MRTIDDVIAAYNFGKPSAAKRGRRAEWPFVPIIDYGRQAEGVHMTRTKQVTGKAFATREEAVACADAAIEYQRNLMRERLACPRHRALRIQYGLPQEARDLVSTTTV